MDSRGMTLLEVLVALVILSIAALAIMKTSATQLHGLARFEQLTFASWVAEDRLTELRLQHVWPAERWTEGNSELFEHKWFWRWRGVATSDAAVRAITLEVRGEPDDVLPVLTLTTYVSRS